MSRSHTSPAESTSTSSSSTPSSPSSIMSSRAYETLESSSTSRDSGHHSSSSEDEPVIRVCPCECPVIYRVYRPNRDLPNPASAEETELQRLNQSISGYSQTEEALTTPRDLNNLQQDDLRAELQSLRLRLQEEIRWRDESENDLELENRVQNLLEEIAFLKNIHQEEIQHQEQP